MFFKTYAALALATSFVVAKPLVPRIPEELPAYHRRGTAVVERKEGNKNNGLGGNNNANLIESLNKVNQQGQVIQIQEQNLQIVQNGNQQQVIQQVNQVLIIDQKQNGANNKMKDMLRKSNYRNNNKDKTTVLLVVQQIQVSVDDGRGNKVQQQVFAQKAVVANRGKKNTETVMVFEAKTLIAQNIQANNGSAAPTAGPNANNTNNQLAVQTNGVQLLGEKPTWTSVAADPAETLAAIWQAELEDAQNAENQAADNGVNNQAAEIEKKALDEANAADGAAKQGGEQKKQGE